MFKNISCGFSLSIFLIGCASYQWVNPANPKADFQSDRAYCQNESTRSVPRPQPNYVNQPTQTTCNDFGGIVRCNTTGGGVARVEDPWATYAYNNNINSYVENCLITRGWRKQEIESKPSFSSKKIPTPDTKSINMSDSGRDTFNYVAMRRKEICSSPEFEDIAKKTPCDPRDIGDQIFNKTYPSKAEIATTKKLHEELQNLYAQEYQAYKTDTGSGSERWRTLMTIYNGRENALFDQFYTGKMTWGDFNKQRSQIFLDRRNAF